MKALERWRVTVGAPRENDGGNLYLVVRPPAGAVDEHGKAVPNPTRKTSRTKNRPEAEGKARALEAELNAQLVGTIPGGLGRDPTFLKVFEACISHKRATESPSRNTLEVYASAKKMFEAVFGDLRDSTVTLAAILRGRDAARVGRQASTVNLYFGLAKTAWTWARSREHVQTTWPVFKKLPEEPTDKRPMTVAEQQAVIEFYRDRSEFWHTFFEFARGLGARSSEVCELREGINLRRAEVKAVASPNGSEPSWWVFVSFITKKSRRKNGKTRDVWIEKRVADLLPVRREGEWLFPARNRRRRGMCVSTDAVLDALKRALVPIGVRDPENVDAHSWRRSGVTDNDDAGCSEFRSMEWTGHESNETHRRYKARAPKKTLETSARLADYRRRTLGEAPDESSGGPAPESALSVADTGPNPRPRQSLCGTRISCSSGTLDAQADSPQPVRGPGPPRENAVASCPVATAHDTDSCATTGPLARVVRVDDPEGIARALLGLAATALDPVPLLDAARALLRNTPAPPSGPIASRSAERLTTFSRTETITVDVPTPTAAGNAHGGGQ